MAIVDEFREALQSALTELGTNEWAVVEARERVLAGLTSNEAFDGIVDVLNLAGEQADQYSFLSCCWLAVSLAKAANTTELPPNLQDALKSLRPKAQKMQAEAELKAVADWYRMTF